MKTAIPIKPIDSTWTDDQWKAIMAKDQNILVAAAAGSGKTAVLVERIIQKIIAKEDPIDVDQLLVATFTNASAAEMRHRIGEALEKEIEMQPASARLRRQLSLLNRASISTLHSFCLDVIRKYYYLIDIDPGFRIADETERDLLRDEVLDDLFELEYGKENNDSFYRLVDTFTNDRSDAALQDLVSKLYDFSRSHPQPNRWLDELVEMYNVTEDMDIDGLPFMETLRFDIHLQLESAKSLLEDAYEVTKLPGGPAPRAENYLDYIEVVNKLLKAAAGPWNELFEAMNNWSFSKAKICKGDEYNKDLLKEADDYKKKAKDILDKLREELFSRKPAFFLRDMREMKDVISTLVSVVKEFAIKFEQMKMEKGLVDFTDIEHYCLDILGTVSADGSSLIPSEAALDYRKQFKEVLVDEYQDTNMVQETILQLVTHDSDENGNLFMVGDVKQSIYRFRLAEPNLFLAKYNRFTPNGDGTGLRIDLSKNFRSRQEVLTGTNYIFKQIMGENVGEISYDQEAELVKGASYPEEISYPIEVAFIDQEDATDDESTDESAEENETIDKMDLEKSQLEARYIAQEIKKLINEQKEIFNPKTGSYRPIQYKDIVILLRSMSWAPEIMEEFKFAGIPIYASLSTGYFEATEVNIVMSLLKVIDNPYQDIPLAGVLRSPIVGLNEEQLAIIRIHSKNGAFYEALSLFLKENPTEKTEVLHEKLHIFIEKLNRWREGARTLALSDLIWQIFRDTHFYDFVGGLPGGKQRQANLRALYDRARQYEATSFRGLFRFLRFIERMQEKGNDLGAARALSEQEDVVRMMTIHSSKGLEFPVVFVAGLSRKFNMMDIQHSYLFDKEFGFACRYTNVDKRITYPSLPQLAFKRKKKLETLSEEMRVLYVALTRAKEKLYLISTLKNVQKSMMKWNKNNSSMDWLLSDNVRARATSYIDWIGPALVRHHDFPSVENKEFVGEDIQNHPSKWEISIHSKEEFMQSEKTELGTQNWKEAVKSGSLLDIQTDQKEDISNVLDWKYPHMSAAGRRSKQSVSEVKRMFEIRDEASGTEIVQKFEKPIFNRPRFMREKKLTPAEKGTALHMVMQHVPLHEMPTVNSVNELLESMVQKELLTNEQQSVIQPEHIIQFFETDLGQRILGSEKVRREVPFSLAISASEMYRDHSLEDESILIQGVIDCLIENDDHIILLDYKSDSIYDRFKGGFEEAKPTLEKRYKTQIDFYEKALQDILQKPVKEKFLYFFDGGHLLKI
ncbi:helicase-exonuclease AddAB subunit AddA [Bacillus sp. FJAT-49736]|uniref:helicase-exonuclease AddAB subunit AddA n=1 Tax=Bacillus sp. FJAT-49736 TaxID=2833582 RepID=UPI001BC9FA72|nr:helicase-exonuclease AddAB subunit AddA [Bacillus sp. FJAT-49736]MBS4172007.1 helicase-exonuclease AddAB subunit AddA [Bacillus sp. FJAT-49736]